MNSDIVFEAVRHGYTELEYSSTDEIQSYFKAIEPDAMIGHISNVKGILFEQEVVKMLNEQGIEAVLFEATNHPISDIAFLNDGEIASEAQLKATDSISYIHSTIDLNPDTPIIVTSEISDTLGDLVINSGISNQLLNDTVSNTLIEQTASEELSSEVASEVAGELLAEAVTDSILPISPVGAILSLFGLPFL